LSRSGLTEVLVAELLPSLFIRQSALVLLPQRVHAGQRQTLFYADGLPDNQLPQEGDSAWLRAERREPARPGLSWVRQVIELRIGADLVGVWLLGKREPDDYYSEPELEGLQHIADQLAIAVIHIAQSELLRELYSANIERQELADRQLAGELHDEVLSRLAALRMLADDGATSPQFDAAFEALTARIRDTISGLRPALLTYGLAAALAELVEDLTLRSGRHPAVRLTVSGEPQRLPKRIEEHLFRIVQQAAENSLAHAQANGINISAAFAPEQVLLEVADDGVGLPFDVLDQLPQLVHNRHFGLAGMIERATLIGASLSFLPAPTGGVLVRLILALPPAAPPADQ
jgi:signal transduction histidine kinase